MGRQDVESLKGASKMIWRSWTSNQDIYYFAQTTSVILPVVKTILQPVELQQQKLNINSVFFQNAVLFASQIPALDFQTQPIH